MSLPMVYRTPYPSNIEPPTNCILTPLPRVYRIPYHGILNPLPMVYRTPTHGILTTLPMVYRTRYPWYFEPSNHGISNPVTHGILTTLPMVYRTPSYGIMTPPLLVKMKNKEIKIDFSGVQIHNLKIYKFNQQNNTIIYEINVTRTCRI